MLLLPRITLQLQILKITSKFFMKLDNLKNNNVICLFLDPLKHN